MRPDLRISIWFVLTALSFVSGAFLLLLLRSQGGENHADVVALGLTTVSFIALQIYVWSRVFGDEIPTSDLIIELTFSQGSLILMVYYNFLSDGSYGIYVFVSVFVIWCALITLRLNLLGPGHSIERRIFFGFGFLSSFAVVFFTIGDSSYFGFSAISIQEYKVIADLIDIRIAFGVATLLVLFVIAARQAILTFQDDRNIIEFPSLPTIEGQGLAAPAINVLIHFVNILIHIASTAATIIWNILLFFGRIGYLSAEIVRSSLSDSTVWRPALKLLLQFILALSLSVMYLEFSRVSLEYFLSMDILDHAQNLAMCILYATIILAFIATILLASSDIETMQETSDAASYISDPISVSVAWVALNLFVSGLFIWLLRALAISAFDNYVIGPYIILILGCIAIGVIVSIRRGKVLTRSGEPRNDPRRDALGAGSSFAIANRMRLKGAPSNLLRLVKRFGIRQ